MSNGPGTDNSKGALATILTSGTADTWVKLGTLALIALSGGGNLFATKQSERATDHEVRAAVKEIHQLHEELTLYKARQKEMMELLEKIDRTTRQ
jgi:hypothetical protein